MHLFHKWSKWEEYTQPMTIHPGILAKAGTPSYKTVEFWQSRTCAVCGKVQREEVKPSN